MPMFILLSLTSADRIPTDKGYRKFVDELMQKPKFLPEASRMIGVFFDETCGELERTETRSRVH